MQMIITLTWSIVFKNFATRKLNGRSNIYGESFVPARMRRCYNTEFHYADHLLRMYDLLRILHVSLFTLMEQMHFEYERHLLWVGE